MASLLDTIAPTYASPFGIWCGVAFESAEQVFQGWLVWERRSSSSNGS